MVAIKKFEDIEAWKFARDRSEVDKTSDRKYISQQHFDQYIVMAGRIGGILQKLIEYSQQ